MRAPVISFPVKSDDDLCVYVCKNDDGSEMCNAQLLQPNNIKSWSLNTVSAEDDHCINVYDEPTKSVTSSAVQINGGNVYCLKCNGLVGKRNNSLIVFDLNKLNEMIIFNFHKIISHFIHVAMEEAN